MASSNLVPNTPLSNRYNGDEDVAEQRTIRLPGGGCNWTNLSLGVDAPKCGCKRFWSKSTGTQSIISDGRGGLEFCMCEHHACFHDVGKNEVDNSLVEVRSTASNPRTQTRKTGDNSEVRRPLQDSNLPDTMQWSRHISGSSHGLPAIPSQCLLPSDNGSMTSGSQTAYTRPFGGLGLDTLSRIGKPVTGMSSLRPQPDDSRMHIYEDGRGNAYLQSLTEGGTPSVAASQNPDPNLDGRITSVRNVLNTIAESQTSEPAIGGPQIQDRKSQIMIKQSQSNTDFDALSVPPHGQQMISYRRNLIYELPERVDNHEKRIDLLENASFSNTAIEELQDVHDHMDTRIGEIESRLDEVEKAHAAQNDASSVGSRQIGSSFASNTSSAMIAAALDHIDPSRVETLEAQVAELQAVAPPSYTRPWEVEVVFLPFGVDLMGIWSTQHTISQRSRLGSTGTEDCTQTKYNSTALAQASLIAYDHSQSWERTATDLEDDDSPWLTAKACALRSRVDERLKSRGLVRTIQICGPDTTDIQAAMLAAFGELPDVLSEDPFSSQDENTGTIPRSLQSFMGLRSNWIPLRKLHKDSRLRFLNPTEMVTPALWTAPFLSSSVAMRHSGTRRLYVTQRDSYLQHLTDSTANWTWQKLRQLPRVYPDQSSFTHTPEADAHEACWTFDTRLDPPPQSTQTSLQSSFASHISSLSIQSLPASPELGQDVDIEPTSPSDHFSSAAVSPTNSTPRTSIAPPLPSSPLRERNPFRPAHPRATSMSSLVPLRDSGPSSQLPTVKRRITAHEPESHSSATLMASTSTHTLRSLEFKRRRISRSPSGPRDTPRWSLGPPSPYPILDESERKRGTTPFAYATPHSNAPYVPRSNVDVYEDEDSDERGSTTDLGLDVDQEGYEQNALSDYEGDRGSGNHNQLHDEWEGVQDEGGVYESRFVGEKGALRHPSPDDLDDVRSEASSQPSEYPSTQQPKDEIVSKATGSGLFERRQRTKLGFEIHVDEEFDGAPEGVVR